MGVKLVSSSGGSVELVAPTTASNFTKSVPATNGALLDENSNIETQVKTATNASGSAPIYSCRAWVNFIGTGTPTIRASGNVSSITDGGTAQFTINFSTAMPDTNYAVVASTHKGAGSPSSTNSAALSVAEIRNTGNVLVEAFRADLVTRQDPESVFVAIFR